MLVLVYWYKLVPASESNYHKKNLKFVMVSFNEPCIKSNSKVNLINIQEKEPFYKKVMTVQFVIVKPESVS